MVLVAIVGCIGVLIAGGIIMRPDFLPDDFGNTTTTTTGNQTIIDVENLTSSSICGLYFSASSSEDWGNNLLSSGETIPANTYVSFSVEIGQTMDIYAEDCNGYTVDTLYDVYVPAEGLTVTYSLNQ